MNSPWLASASMHITSDDVNYRQTVYSSGQGQRFVPTPLGFYTYACICCIYVGLLDLTLIILVELFVAFLAFAYLDLHKHWSFDFM